MRRWLTTAVIPTSFPGCSFQKQHHFLIFIVILSLVLDFSEEFNRILVILFCKITPPCEKFKFTFLLRSFCGKLILLPLAMFILTAWTLSNNRHWTRNHFSPSNLLKFPEMRINLSIPAPYHPFSEFSSHFQSSNITAVVNSSHCYYSSTTFDKTMGRESERDTTTRPTYFGYSRPAVSSPFDEFHFSSCPVSYIQIKW